MKTLYYFLGSILITICLSSNVLLAQKTSFEAGQVLIKLKSDRSTAQKNNLKAQMNGKSIKAFNNLDIELWEVGTPGQKIDVLQLVDQYSNHPDIEFIEPNYIVSIGTTIPNDPSFNNLWGLNNNNLSNADIDAPEAWDIATGSPSVVVGIIDSGIDYAHEDLVDNIWHNLGEDADGDGTVLEWDGSTWIFDPGDENGIDDDGNGYVDDFVGWDFANNDNDPFDGNSHGTHVAGTVGASGNNNIGITGVTWDVQLAALKFLSDHGSGSTANGLAALNYAVAMGMPISNNSWGGGSYSSALYQGLQNADANGHLFIASAGNKNANNDIIPQYPCSYDNDNIISVISTTSSNNRSSFSSYGPTRSDLGAPGSSIYSCVPFNGYGSKNGTSMAAPHVAGACALLWGNNPDKTHDEIKEAILNSVEIIPALDGLCVSDGLLNLYNAMTYFPNSGCRYNDSLALVDLYNATGGNTTWQYNWNLNQNMNTWYGITLNGQGCVTQINLPSAQLSGSLPSSLGNLSYLSKLDLSNNQLTGSIPATLGNLSNLNQLYLDNNQMNGCYDPNLTNLCGQLINSYRVSNGNNFDALWDSFCSTGSGACAINSCRYQDSLSLVAIYNSAGGANWSNPWNLNQPMNTWSGVTLNANNCVRELNLASRGLSGTIAPELGNLSSLEIINFQSNLLSGSIPSSISELDNLTSLNLAQNNLSSSIPSALGTLVNLENLNLQDNSFNSVIPISFGNLINIEYIDLSQNNLTGNIPVNFGNLSNLIEINLQDNLLTGTIPSGLGNLGNLSKMILSYNDLSGCYYSDLDNLCSQLSPGYSTNTYISVGNNFDAAWETFCSNGTATCIPGCRYQDSLSLIALYNSTGGANWNNPWNLGQPMDDWTGITLNTDGCVTSIDLTQRLLSGTIAPELGNLSELTDLRLFQNVLSGNIPSSLGNLSELTYLTLGNNNLTGSIPPSLGNLSNLTNLILQSNDLTGNIPPELANLSSITQMFLNGNNFTGEIPQSFGNLSYLQSLNLYGNQLTGPIPSSFGNLNSLTSLNVSQNNLSGCYDANLSNLCNQLFFLSNTNNWISNGNNFDAPWEDFCVSSSGICDTPPPSGCRYLDSLNLVVLYNATNGANWTTSWNLSQPIDSWYGISLNANGCVSCIDLDGSFDCTDTSTAGNNLSGNIPTEIGNFSDLVHLSLSGNNLSGNIPQEIGNLTNLTGLHLADNNLTGNIPSQIGNLTNLTELDLSRNQLSGSIPVEISNLTNLTSLALFLNQLNGNIPGSIGNLVNLTYVGLHFNNLSGSIPVTLGNLSNVTYFSAARNQLSGSIPSEIGNMVSLNILDLHTNNLSGNIPSILGNLNNLTYLYLSDNQLDGSIPAELGNLNLQYLWLHNNNLSGCYSAELQNLCNTLVSSSNKNEYISNGNNLNAPWESFCLSGSGECIGAPIGCRLTDSLALVAFYNSTNGPGWTNSWNLSQPMDTWYGVALNSDGCVTCIDLDDNPTCVYDPYHLYNIGNNLSGSIPADIGNLSQLEYMSLPRNQLNGNIPPEIGSLSKLRHINLAFNFQISGSIPQEIVYLEDLELLMLSFNSLSGSIPSGIGYLSNLNRMWINNNQLTGSIPPELGNLSNLAILALQRNQLSGSIPAEIGNLSNLTGLFLNNNQLSGCYDANLSSLCSQLGYYSTSNYVSSGNSLDATWEDFCNTSAGECLSDVWPGDFNNDGIANNFDILYWGQAEGNSGQTRPSATNTWVGQPASGWTTDVNGINGKYQDGDGNGIVDLQDFQVLLDNYNSIHSFGGGGSPVNDVVFSLEFISSSSDATTTSIEYALYAQKTDGAPIEITGAACNIVFDDLNLLDLSMDISGSALQPDERIEVFDGNNILEIGLTRIDKTNQLCLTPIATITAIVATEDISNGLSYGISILQGNSMKGDGSVQSAASTTFYEVYSDVAANSDNMLLTADVEHAQCLFAGSAEVQIEGGTAGYDISWNTGETTAMISDLTPGIYTVTVSDATGLTNTLAVEIEGQYIPVYDDFGNLMPCIELCPTILDFIDVMPDAIHQANAVINTNAIINIGENPILKAGNIISLQPGFTLPSNSGIIIEIENCSDNN